MLEKGFVKLYRSLLKWEWYDDPKTLKLFIHLLMTVNIEDSHWHGIEVPKGSRVTSIRALAGELHFTNREIRTHLARLESTGSDKAIIPDFFSNYSVKLVGLPGQATQ